jgi:hypothetical protein
VEMLIIACVRSWYDVVRLLVTEHGINSNGVDDNPGQHKTSPMMIALEWGNEKLMSMLLALGASKVDPKQSCRARLFADGIFPKPKGRW